MLHLLLPPRTAPPRLCHGLSPTYRLFFGPSSGLPTAAISDTYTAQDQHHQPREDDVVVIIIIVVVITPVMLPTDAADRES